MTFFKSLIDGALFHRDFENKLNEMSNNVTKIVSKISVNKEETMERLSKLTDEISTIKMNMLEPENLILGLSTQLYNCQDSKLWFVACFLLTLPF